MLSPEAYHLAVPRDVPGNLRYRAWLIHTAPRDANMRAGLVACCRDDIHFFIDSYGWCFDPRKVNPADRVSPFILWDYQRDALTRRPGGLLYGLERGRTCLIQKSRDMGATWVCVYLDLWLALFHDWSQILWNSRTEKLVDSDSPDSLFWKLRHAAGALPEFLTGAVKDKTLFMQFGRSKGVIAGEATTGQAGVGGRATHYFGDEFAENPHAQTVREKTASTADARVFNGTHKGVGTAFFEMSRSPEIDVLTWHWSLHPEKRKGLYCYDPERPTQPKILDPAYPFPADYRFVLDGSPVGGPYPGLRSPWYDRKCIDIGRAQAVAQDLDINPSGAASQWFEAMLIRDLTAAVARPPLWVGFVDEGRLVARPGGLVKLWLPVGPDGRPVVAAGDRFGAGADISRGRGATPSVLMVYSALTGEKVLEWADAGIDHKEFAALTVDLLRLLGDVKIAWERNGVGAEYGSEVIKLGWSNYYTKTDEDDPVKKYKPSTRPGWENQDKSLTSVFTKYETALKERRCLNRSAVALENCLGWQTDPNGCPAHPKKKNRDKTADPNGAGMNHGDHSVADALAWFMVEKLGLVTAPEAPRERWGPHNPHPGSLAYRRRLYENRLREAEEYA